MKRTSSRINEPRSRYLNLGCGERFHPDWDNVDMYPYGPAVRVHNLTKTIPFPDEAFEVVYHSHVLEHFPRTEAPRFVRECYRLLKPHGVIRIAVPDLERIARLYLESLEKAAGGIPGWSDNYDWMVMEMLDQCVREETRGALVDYLSREPLSNHDFVVSRWGPYAMPLIESIRANFPKNCKPAKPTDWRYVFHNPGKVLRNKLIKVFLNSEDWEALRVGRFRRSGEVHMWMYDYYSLGRLLEKVGFRNPQRMQAAESQIPGWAEFRLDNEADGRPYKADSIYIEALKP